MKKHYLLLLLLGFAVQVMAEDTAVPDPVDTTYDYAWYDSLLNENFTVKLLTCNEQRGLKDLTSDHCFWKANSSTAAVNEIIVEGGKLNITHERISDDANWTEISLQFVDWIGGTGDKFGPGADTVAGMYVNMENEVIVTATVASTHTIDLRLDLMDVNGHVANSGTERNTVRAGVAQDYEFDFSEQLYDWYAGDFWGVSNGRYAPSGLTVGDYTKRYGAQEFIPFDASKVAKIMWGINDWHQGMIGEEINVQISNIVVGDEYYAVSFYNYDDTTNVCQDRSSVIQALYPNPKGTDEPNEPNERTGVSCETAFIATEGLNDCSLGYDSERWFTYTASTSGTYMISNCGQSSDDTYVYVYNSCGGVLVAYNDDDCGLQTSTTFEAVAGQTFYIEWKSYDEYTSTFGWEITLDEDLPPSGDTGENCSNPITAYEGLNTCSVDYDSDQWFVFTPSESDTYIVSNCGKSFDDTYVNVYATCAGSAIVYNDDYCDYQTRASFSAIAGISYYIKWNTYGESTSEFNWTIAPDEIIIPVDTTLEDTTYDYAWFDSSLNENFTVLLNTCNEQRGLKDLTEDHCNWIGSTDMVAKNDVIVEGGKLKITHERISTSDNWTSISLQFVDWIGDTGNKFGPQADTVGGMYVNMEDEVIVYATISSTSEIDLRLDLMDVNGHVGNSGTVRNTIVPGAARDYEFDFDETLYDWYAGDFWGVSNGRYSTSGLTVGDYTKKYGAQEFIPFDASKVAKMMWGINDAKQGTLGEEIVVEISNIIVGDEDYAVSYRNFDDEYYNCFDGSNIIQAIYPNPRTNEYQRGISCENPLAARLGTNTASVSDEQSQWFAFTPNESGSYVVSNCGKTHYDTELSIISDCIGIPVDYNDDYCDYQSQVTFDAIEGSTYYIRWGVNSSYTRDFDWTIAKESSEYIPLHSTGGIAPIYKTESFDTFSLDLDSYYSSSLPISYSVSVISGADVVSALVMEEYLYIISEYNHGMATLLLTASDGETTVTEYIEVFVRDPDAPGQDPDNPVVVTIGENHYNATIPTNFYSFTPSESGRYSISSCNKATINTLAMVFEDFDTENVIAFNDDYCGEQTRLIFDANEGVEYFIYWEAEETGTVSFDWDIEKVGDVSESLTLIKPTTDITLNLTDDFYVISFADYFSSAETIEYEVLPDSYSYVSIEHVYGVLALGAIELGTTTITISATSGGKQLIESFDVHVVDQLPCTDCAGNVVSESIQDVLMNEGYAKSVDLSSYFTHENGGVLYYDIAVSNRFVSYDLSNSLLTFYPSGGSNVSTEFTVIASDIDGNSTSETFTVTVYPNRAPIVVLPIEDKVLELGEVLKIDVDLSLVFSDLDGDELTYDYSLHVKNGSDPVLVFQTDEILMLSPVDFGQVLIEVDASDGNSSQTTSFTVNVIEAGNEMPKPIEPVITKVISVGDGSGIVLDDLFTDDQDDLTYTWISDDYFEVADDVINTKSLSSGLHQLEVTVDDGKGGVASVPVNLVVQELNVIRPLKKQEIDLDISLTGLASDVEIDLSEYFVDLNGEPLSYSVSSNNSNIATATIDGQKLYIQGKGEGSTTVDLLIVTEAGGFTTKEFTVDYSGDIVISTMELSQDNLFKVYPTLVNDILTIETYAGAEIQLFTLQSLMVKTVVAQSGIVDINVSDLQAGMYVVLVDGEQARFIKQ